MSKPVSPAHTVVGNPVQDAKAPGKEEPDPKVSGVSPAAPMLTEAEAARIASMPTGATLYLVMTGLFMAVYVVSLGKLANTNFEIPRRFPSTLWHELSLNTQNRSNYRGASHSYHFEPFSRFG